jgi:hypothetical protein
MLTKPYRMRVYSHDQTDFRTVTGRNVLMYWPHGFGDWIMLGYLLPLLDSSNRYWVTRFGDDYVSVIEDNAYAAPAYLGISSPHCDDGGTYGIPHFGIERTDGSENEVKLPLSLYRLCVENEIDTLLWPGFPETYGGIGYPYHSKPRYLIQHLVPDAVRQELKVHKPLPNAVMFHTPPALRRFVEAKLESWTGFGERKLCLIGRTGFTAHGKNWGHLWRAEADSVLPEGEECRDFMRLMLQRDSRWMFLSLEDRLYEGQDTLRSEDLHCYSYAALFGENGTVNVPYGLVMKALAELADLFVGVPSGPYCLSMVKPELPTVGIWIEHFPSWYSEPKPDAIHVISRNVYDTGSGYYSGSFLSQGELHYRAHRVDTRRITGEQVLNAVEELLT